jgi:hypothetical protein
VNRPRVAGLVLPLLMLAWSGASAETAPGADTVILLEPTTASVFVRRSLARIRDELSADRFRVIVADASTIDEPGDGGTIVALFGDPDTGHAELCVVQRAARRAAIRRATVIVDDPERMPEALATRALELLRATALELSLEIERAPRLQKPPDPQPEPGIPPGPAPPAVAPESAVVTVDMGIGMWNSIEGPPPAVVPLGRIGLRLSDWAWARLSAAGLGSRPQVETVYGSAALSQTMALAEFVAMFRRGKRVRPLLSAGAGFLNVAVVGTGAAPYEGRERQRWSAALDGGAGVAFVIGSRAALVTELHALVASPHPVVRFVDVRAATVGYPSVVLTLALQVAL